MTDEINQAFDRFRRDAYVVVVVSAATCFVLGFFAGMMA